MNNANDSNTSDTVAAETRAASILESGRNCWRIERADRLALIVDAADYFVHLRQVLIAAKREVLLIGWDFDFEIDMLPGETETNGLAPDGYPKQLGDFLEAVVENSPELHIYMLKWNGAVIAAPGRFLPTMALRVFANERIHFALDGHHPFGACHHQKIVVADDSIAFCGGIDATEDRWDTSEHAPDDARRTRKDGSLYGPWHDATTALTGAAARALAELSRRRWHRATGDEITAPDDAPPPVWPDGLPVDLRDVDVGIARTEPPYDGAEIINEIELLYLDAIKAARERIYIESQYFATESVCAALEERLKEDDGPEVVVINPEAAKSELEDRAMHVLRGRMIRRLRAVDHAGRFRIYHPINAARVPIYVHAKILIVDDRLLRIGSSNLNERSMGFDTECDVAFECDEAEARDTGQVIAGFRARLLAEHFGAASEVVEQLHRDGHSILDIIDELNSDIGRGLVSIEPEKEDWLDGMFADKRLLDPRYLPGETTSAGQGIRPRHLAVAAAVVGIGFLGWYVWRSRSRT